MKVSPEKTSVKQLILKLQNRKELMEWAYMETITIIKLLSADTMFLVKEIYSLLQQ